MSLINNIKNAFSSKDLEPTLNIKKGQVYRYKIEMKNKYLNSQGKVVKRQHLESEFSREIVDTLYSFCGLTSINIDKVEYFKKIGEPPMRWTFAEGSKIPYYFYSCKTPEQIKIMSNESVFKVIESQVGFFQGAFEEFPKLPSVYLFIMQVYDIIAFELFATYLCSTPGICDVVGKEIHIGGLSSQKYNIGINKYSKDSFFDNAKFYAKFLGYSFYKERVCSVFEYTCDNSKVKMEDKNSNFDRTREGVSYYSGLIYLDMETGLPVMGTMLESYIAVQKSSDPGSVPQTNLHIRRRIRMDLIHVEDKGD